MSWIELQEQTDPHVLPRRLYVNTDSIAYIVASSETAPALLHLCCVENPVLPVIETFERVQELIDGGTP